MAVEESYKDTFRNRLRENYSLAAKNLDLPTALADDFFYLSKTLRPVLEKIEKLKSDDVSEKRISTLKKSAEKIFQKFDFKNVELHFDLSAEENISNLIEALSEKHDITDKENVKKQAASWKIGELKDKIYKINEIETIVKTNSGNSLNLVSDFIVNN